MKRLPIFILLLATLNFSNVLFAQDDTSKSSEEDKYLSLLNLNRSASFAAKKFGIAEEASITCDHQFIVCTCMGAFDCAWLSLACADAGGIQGFDGECYLPDSVEGARAAINDFSGTITKTEASCDGIFCSCTGPADSQDCKQLKACIDDISCIGNDCGCIGGHVD